MRSCARKAWLPEPAFETLHAARRLNAAGIDAERAEVFVEVRGQSVGQLPTREHIDEGIAKLGTALHARIDGVDFILQSVEATVRTEILRAVLIGVDVLIQAIGLMMAIATFYSARGGGRRRLTCAQRPSHPSGRTGNRRPGPR